MSFTLINNRGRFSSSHPVCQPFRMAQGLESTPPKKGTPHLRAELGQPKDTNKASHGDLVKLREDREKKRWFENTM